MKINMNLNTLKSIRIKMKIKITLLQISMKANVPNLTNNIPSRIASLPKKIMNKSSINYKKTKTVKK